MTNLLKNRDYAALFTGRIFSSLTEWLLEVVVLVTIFERTRSPILTAGAMVARQLPLTVIAPFAGVVVDRFDRKSVLAAVQVARFGILLGLYPVLRAESLNVWIVYAIFAALALTGAFNQPAILALMPGIVRKEQLVSANSLMMGIFPLSMALAFILGGWLLAVSTHDLIITLMLGFTVLAVIAYVLIREPHERAIIETDGSFREFVSSLRNGWGYLKKHKLARSLTVMEMFEHIPHGIWTSALLLVFVQEALGAGSAEWGQQNAAFAAAMFIGAIVGIILSKPLARVPGWIIIINAALSGVFTLLYSQTNTNIVAVLNAFIFGIPMALRDVAQDSLLQSSVSGELLGRIAAFRDTGRNGVFMVAGVFFAWLASYIDIRTIYIIGGILYFGTAVYAVSQKALRESEVVTDDA